MNSGSDIISLPADCSQCICAVAILRHLSGQNSNNHHADNRNSQPERAGYSVFACNAGAGGLAVTAPKNRPCHRQSGGSDDQLQQITIDKWQQTKGNGFFKTNKAG